MAAFNTLPTELRDEVYAYLVEEAKMNEEDAKHALGALRQTSSSMMREVLGALIGHRQAEEWKNLMEKRCAECWNAVGAVDWAPVTPEWPTGDWDDTPQLVMEVEESENWHEWQTRPSPLKPHPPAPPRCSDCRLAIASGPPFHEIWQGPSRRPVYHGFFDGLELCITELLAVKQYSLSLRASPALLPKPFRKPTYFFIRPTLAARLANQERIDRGTNTDRKRGTATGSFLECVTSMKHFMEHACCGFTVPGKRKYYRYCARTHRLDMYNDPVLAASSEWIHEEYGQDYSHKILDLEPVFNVPSVVRKWITDLHAPSPYLRHHLSVCCADEWKWNRHARKEKAKPKTKDWEDPHCKVDRITGDICGECHREFRDNIVGWNYAFSEDTAADVDIVPSLVLPEAKQST